MSSSPPDPYGYRPPESWPPPTPPPSVPPAASPVVCTWHPDRQTALRCTRCGRPACPECLTPASVGFQCRACVAEGRATSRTARTVSGSPHGQQPMVTIGLIAINIVVFVITVIQAGGTADLERSSWFRQGALTPILVSSGRVLAAAHLWFPAPVGDAHRTEHAGALLRRAAAGADDRPLAVSRRLSAQPAGRFDSGDAVRGSGLDSGRRIRRDLRAAGRARRGVRQVPLRLAAADDRGGDQPGDHLRDPGYLVAGPPRWAGRRWHRRSRDGLPAAEDPDGLAGGASASPCWPCSSGC